MPPILYGKHASPPCRAVLLTARAINLELDLKDVDMLTSQEHLTEKYLSMNPCHTIPLLDDDGFYIWESRAIMGYLVEKYAKNDDLYPKDLRKRARVNNILYFDIGCLLKSVQNYYFPMLRGEEPDPAKLAEVDKALKVLDTLVKQLGFVAAERPTIADFACLSTLATIDVFKVERKHHRNISLWIERINAAMPYYEDFVRPGIESLTLFLLTRIEAAQKAKREKSAIC